MKNGDALIAIAIVVTGVWYVGYEQGRQNTDPPLMREIVREIVKEVPGPVREVERIVRVPDPSLPPQVIIREAPRWTTATSMTGAYVPMMTMSGGWR